ncbi:MAG TPA: hypothetical protein VEG67_04950 [Myxococcota bacterium]|nr:hypothetical protein [Myxococcota bacterium]
MKTTRLLSLFIGFGVAASACVSLADDALQIVGSEVGRDGVLTRRLAEVVGTSGPTSTPILAINSPQGSGPVYEISGMVEYSDVEGDGYLEMGTSFPEGQEFFTRTLDPTGDLGKLSGSSGPRRFALPVELVQGAPAPSRLVLNVVLPGGGHVTLSDLHLSGGSATSPLPRAWWSARVGSTVAGAGGGAIVLVGVTVGILCALGRSRRFAESLLSSLLGLGIGAVAAGGAALALGQPRVVWLPLLLLGVPAVILPVAFQREMRRRFGRFETRRLRF